ncbi:WXG100 family type VII secretion target [Glycomyces xiaoerkulensis]|uniref:WXG100 family type VII secretion target n=1 Tax=Glycomyces xiaoerkulensis TaxID=2038139 RepID=UPI000C26A890|nr:hypothetical protein [Glycomyces xiaoerkulensis]
MADDSLIASADDIDPSMARDGWTGMSFAEDYKGISQAIESGDWVAGSVAGIGAGLNVAATVIDPFSSLLAMGISWAMEQVEPLREALDWLAGDPETVETHAITWDNMAEELFAIGDELVARLETDLQTWQGQAADAYREMLGVNADVAYGSGGTALGMASATRGAGGLVTAVREFVREFIADCIARVVVWLAEVVFSLGLATPVVAAQLAAAVVKWTGTIFSILTGLVESIQNLRALLDI